MTDWNRSGGCASTLSEDGDLSIETGGVAIDVEQMHTRYFQPVHRDGAPHFLHLTISASRLADDVVIPLNCDEAVELGSYLLRVGGELKAKNEEETS